MHGEVISQILFNMHVNEIQFEYMKPYLLFFFPLMYANNMESTEGLQIFLFEFIYKNAFKDQFKRLLFLN